MPHAILFSPDRHVSTGPSLPGRPADVAALLMGVVLVLVGGCSDGKPQKVTSPSPSSPSATPVAHGSVSSPSSVESVTAADTKRGDTSPPLSPSTTNENPASETAPSQTFRPADPRNPLDDAPLAAMGIHCYESRRLKLYTDIAAEKVQHLPGYVDQLYEALEEYFGPMPPDRVGSDFQMTGYLIGDEALFREVKLVPENLPKIEHGRHRANEFWLRDQAFDYYRAHLLLHEATHCFMTYMPDTQSPVWYLEGMAEFFATHRQAEDGTLNFGIMPSAPEEVPGWGRISLIRDAFARSQPKSMPQIFALGPLDFFDPEPYAWSWGLCEFLCRHPRYRERFQTLGQQSRGRNFPEKFASFFDDDMADMATEWMLFVVNLQYGYDVERSAITFLPTTSLNSDQAQLTTLVKADHGWQSTGLVLKAGELYRVQASGQITLADTPKPWICEPDGVSIDYVDGQPIGKLLGCLRSDDHAASSSMVHILAIGREKSFKSPVTGTLFLRVNDGWDRLVDNTGDYEVRITRED